MTRGPDLNIKLSTLFVSTFRGGQRANDCKSLNKLSALMESILIKYFAFFALFSKRDTC